MGIPGLLEGGAVLVIPGTAADAVLWRRRFEEVLDSPTILCLVLGAPPQPTEQVAQAIATAAENTELRPEVVWLQNPASILRPEEQARWWLPERPVLVVLTPGRAVSDRMDANQVNPWSVFSAVVAAGTR